MSLPADTLYRIWILKKPQMSEICIYRTFDAAMRACCIAGAEVEEWVAVEGTARLQQTVTWLRLSDGTLLMQPVLEENQ